MGDQNLFMLVIYFIFSVASFVAAIIALYKITPKTLPYISTVMVRVHVFGFAIYTAAHAVEHITRPVDCEDIIFSYITASILISVIWYQKNVIGSFKSYWT